MTNTDKHTTEWAKYGDIHQVPSEHRHPEATNTPPIACSLLVLPRPLRDAVRLRGHGVVPVRHKFAARGAVSSAAVLHVIGLARSGGGGVEVVVLVLIVVVLVCVWLGLGVVERGEGWW